MACSHRRRDETRQFCLVRVGGVHKPLIVNRHELCTVNRKNTPKCFCHILSKTQPILIRFGVYCPE